jgi:hypothetical protein
MKPVPQPDFKDAMWIGCSSQQFALGRKYGCKIDGIVIHVMDGYLGDLNNGTGRFFNMSPAERLTALINVWIRGGRKGPRPTAVSQSSAHYGVNSKAIHQYVYETDTAWHAGVLDKPTWSALQRNKQINPNAWTIGIEHEGFANTVWSDELYMQSAKLVRYLCLKYNLPITRDYIGGHHELYSLKTCPGLCDLDKLVKLAA